MRTARLALKRVAFAAPQVLGITLVTFIMLRLLPGNPAYVIAGQFATEERVRRIETSLGLDRPLTEQYLIYLQRLSRGDLGDSWFTTRDVSEEFLERGPATLELITYSLMAAVVLGFTVAGWAALRPRGYVDALLRMYGNLAGAVPLFWLALVLSYVFFFRLGWAPPPLGRLDPSMIPPARVTGFYTIDSLVAADWNAFRSAVAHLVLPVSSLVLFYTSLILKLSRASIEENLQSDYCLYARACGLPERMVLRYAMQNSVPPLLALSGLIYGAMVGGAVLVESVFSWNGLGSYAVESVVRSDYFPVQGFVLITAIFNLIVYFFVDLIQYTMDPRLEY